MRTESQLRVVLKTGRRLDRLVQLLELAPSISSIGQALTAPWAILRPRSPHTDRHSMIQAFTGHG